MEMQIDPRPTSWEIEQIKVIDNVWLQVQAEKEQAERDSKGKT